MNGSPHAHCLFWVQDAPKINRDPDEVVCAFIDKHITATPPTKTHENEHDIKLMENSRSIHTLTTAIEINHVILAFQNHLQPRCLYHSLPPQSEDNIETLNNATKILQQVQQMLFHK